MYDTLISASKLATGLQSGAVRYRVLDCRARLQEPGFGAAAFADGHIPGAVRADLDQDFAAPAGAGGRHPLPDQQTLATKLRGWGINTDDQIVVYDDAGGAFAARAWWCLRWLGHRATAVLDGGVAAWPGPWSQTTSDYPPGNFTTRPALTRTIDAADLSAHLSARELIDARSPERFAGKDEPIDPVAGHIPGAVCLPFQDNLGPDGCFKPAAALRARFSGLSEDVVCYCGSGVTAAHNVLAMRIASLPEPVLYPGSWSEWILDPTRLRAP